MEFTTSTGITKTKEELKAALKVVSKNKRELSEAIYVLDSYASHVTEQEKKDILAKGHKTADDIEAGNCNLTEFWLWQLINEVFTGKLVGYIENP